MLAEKVCINYSCYMAKTPVETIRTSCLGCGEPMTPVRRLEELSDQALRDMQRRIDQIFADRQRRFGE